MRTGIFGGTFDPVHLGHLVLAEQCREACRLDRVLFVPAGQPPHKADREITPSRQRREMVELAIVGHAAFELCTVELDRAGPSYTVETLERVRAERPNDALFLLMGADSLADLPLWREPRRIAELAAIVVATRPGFDALDLDQLRGVLTTEQIARVEALHVPIPRIEISSRDLRQRVVDGRSIRYLVPRAVECYVETHGLYRAGGSGSSA